MKRLRLLCVLLLLPMLSRAQTNIKDSGISVAMVGVQYAFQMPGGDIANRFGYNSAIGPNFWYKTPKNWLYGFEMNFIFGSQVKENPIQGISTDDGHGNSFLINNDGQPQLLQMYERGYTTFLKVGKIFPVVGPNPNSGLFVKGGLGFLQHKIRYYWSQNGPPQLQTNYVKGYDRLTNGLATTESLGYFHLSSKNYLNFSAEFEFIQGFTQNRRDWNFDQMRQDTAKRLDLFYGIKISWFFPLYHRTGSEVFY